MVWFAGFIPVQWVELWVGLIAEGLIPHVAKVKIEAVHQKVNSDPGSPGLWSYCWSGTKDEGGAVHCAARFILQEDIGTLKLTEMTERLVCWEIMKCSLSFTSKIFWG